MSIRAVCFLTGVIFGSIPNGYLLAKSKGVDLRHTGSGNIGSTNVLRSMGRGYGALTLILDMLKSIVPVIFMQIIFKSHEDMRYLITLYTGFGAVLGHDFSPWLHFNGGKGIATSGGIIAITDPIIFIIDLVTIFGTAIVTGYVSLGSLLAASFYFIFNVIMVVNKKIPGWSIFKQNYANADAAEIILIAFLVTALAFFRHKANIVRLLNGSENKISLKK